MRIIDGKPHTLIFNVGLGRALQHAAQGVRAEGRVEPWRREKGSEKGSEFGKDGRPRRGKKDARNAQQGEHSMD